MHMTSLFQRLICLSRLPSRSDRTLMERSFMRRQIEGWIWAHSTRAGVFSTAAVVLLLSGLLAGCNRKVNANTDESIDPPPAIVERNHGPSLVVVDDPERFPLATATGHSSSPELKVTGVVSPDISRNVPVISIATGRVLEIRARLGDTVTKGQLLMRVLSADISQAFSDYRQALADEKLAAAQLDRSKILYSHGATAQKDLEVAVDTEEKAKVTVETTIQHLKVLGADKDNPSTIVDITAPVSGVITDQQVTMAAGTQGLGSPNAFTISDLSCVWILCDVYENDLSFVHLGEYADIRLNAYPDIVYKGRLSNIGPILDPNIRTAKVRIEVDNPGLMRVGMFVRATFHGEKRETHAVLPASAILHLHDRDWVYMPEGPKSFRRVEVQTGGMLGPGQQEVLSGVRPGERVVLDALDIQNSIEY
jgi:membrane fusion protein, heavy metal efflux system